VVVRGQARDKAGGKTHNADKVICIDRTTLAAQFFGPGYHPGDYAFTLVTDTIRQRSTVSPRRVRYRAFASMALRHSHATGRLRPENWRESEIISARIGQHRRASR
jgi:hypothetical protein